MLCAVSDRTRSINHGPQLATLGSSGSLHKAKGAHETFLTKFGGKILVILGLA